MCGENFFNWKVKNVQSVFFLGNHFSVQLEENGGGKIPLENFKWQFGLILRKRFYERENEKFRVNTSTGDCLRSFFEFSQTFMIVSMTPLRTGRTCFIFLFVNTARNLSDINHELLFSNSQNPELALGVRRSSRLAVSILIVTCWSTSEKHEIKWSRGLIFRHEQCVLLGKLAVNGNLQSEVFLFHHCLGEIVMVWP